VSGELEELCRSHGAVRRERLEDLYRRFNRPEYRAGDPVSFVWRYAEEEDRKVAAWIAAALAYGRVSSILGALTDLDRRWEGRPARFLQEASERERQKALSGFVYRWTRAGELGAMLGLWHRYGKDIPRRLAEHPQGYRAALGEVRAQALAESPGADPGHLFPDPHGSGACKRLAMWLRWMCRADAIDPGLWADRLDASRLWVPLDTHMFRISRRLGLTRRRQSDAEAARRITRAYARICPADPLRYDFALTRLGMGAGHPDM
jgi:uncharacterized protein (TIGR02757 family)